MIAVYTFPNNAMPDNLEFNPIVELDAFTRQFKSTWSAVWPNGQTVEITALNGLTWAKKPQIEIKNGTSGIAVFPDITLNSENKTISFTHSMPRSNTTIYITVTDIVLEEPIPTIEDNFLTYYCVTNKTLYDLSQAIIYNTSSSGDRNIVDLTPFITSLRQYPFEIPKSDSTKNIVLGTNDTKIASNLLTARHYEIDLGSVKMPSTNNNSNDFAATICIILPYIGIRTLNAAWYAGQTVSLIYDVDLTQGLFTATLTINNIITDIFTGIIGKEAPYKLTSSETLANFINTDIQDNYPLQASITILYHQNYDNLITNDNKRGVISSFEKGILTQLTDIVFNDAIPSIIQGDISAILAQGIIL